ncbi:hypothetical protein [Parafrankia sp. Ea1.12]|uniref:hypothetical protein n=1 Tax=Parafrankia sp. Ea1.12 TaxID=573499 RepID=UPI00190F4D6A|nr:hypothetical protein [Parafrankia sp. Ea1.12]
MHSVAFGHSRASIPTGWFKAGRVPVGQESAQLSWMRKVLAFGKGAFTHTRHVFTRSR